MKILQVGLSFGGPQTIIISNIFLPQEPISATKRNNMNPAKNACSRQYSFIFEFHINGYAVYIPFT